MFNIMLLCAYMKCRIENFIEKRSHKVNFNTYTKCVCEIYTPSITRYLVYLVL